MNMDQQFVDVDFPSQTNYVFGVSAPPCFEDVVLFADEIEQEDIPASEWPRLVEEMEANKSGTEYLVSRIYNQGQEGSCVANACAQANEILQAVQLGKENVTHLSAMSLYKRIGRSAQSGAMVNDGLSEMRSRGVLPLDTPENRAKYGDAVMPNTGWRTAMPANWEATAANFKGAEARIVRRMSTLISELLRQHPVVVGRAGHSICYLRPTYRNGRLHVLYVNSWGGGVDGGGWGGPAGEFKSGFGLDSESYIRQSSSWAFALRSVT